VMQQPSSSSFTPRARRNVWWITFSAYVFITALIFAPLHSPLVWLAVLFIKAFHIQKTIPKQPYATELPGRLEKILAWFASFNLTALMGVVVMLANLLIKYVSMGILWLVQLAWPQANFNPVTFSGILLSIIYLLGILFSLFAPADRVARLLYPNVAGIRSAFYDDAVNRRKRTITRLTIGVLILLVWLGMGAYLGWLDNAEYQIFTLFALFGFASQKEPFNDLPQQFGTVYNTTQAVGKVLQTAGYTVTPYPRTGQSEIDPSLLEVDLYAEKNNRLIVVDVVGDNEPRSTNPAARCGNLALASMLLGDFLQQQRPSGSPVLNVEPLMFLVDQPLSEDWHRAAKRDDVRVTRIESSVLELEQAERDSRLRTALRPVANIPRPERPEQSRQIAQDGGEA
jgi:hypothetical protein